MKIQITTICLILTFLTLSISTPIITGMPDNIETSVPEYKKDFLRGVKIDFTPPKMVQNSGSSFVLNVTITRTRIRPIIFSIVVFMRLKDEFGKDHTVRIGSKPYVIFPQNAESIIVSIPCLTKHDFASDANCLFSGATSGYNLSDGSIGVRIDRVSRWVFDDIFWKVLIKDNIEPEKWSEWTSEEITQFISLLERISTLWKNSGTIFKFRCISALSIFMSHATARNKMIVWEKTKILPSFISSTEISMNATIDNETDDNGHFKVSVTIKNNLDTDVYALVLVDMSDRSFINSLLPMFKGITIYNVGYWKCFVKKYESNWTEIQCNFSDKGFDKKDYKIVVECAPYIPMGNSNLYGVYFFDMRWQMLIKPYYIINGKATNLIREMWYNTPIFYGKPSASGQLFQIKSESILYKGNTSADKLIDDVTKKLLDQPLIVLLIVFLIGAPYTLIVLLIYRNIRKTKRN
jgi:hypothetical protein